MVKMNEEETQHVGVVRRKKPNHETKDCTKQFNCANCQGNHAAYSRECNIWKTEIMEVKYRRNISFPEAKKNYRRLYGKTNLH